MFTFLRDAVQGKASRARSARLSTSSYQRHLDDTENGSRRPLIPRDQSADDENSDIEDEDGEGDDNDDADPLLPIFSAAHLDSLPVYSLTHTIRLLIVDRCETTLSWEQLRSPQISQFLVKPVQNQIRTSHFSRATLYALLANCLQFKKEGQVSPGIVGICNTRAQLAELLAMRVLKDFNARELIDALSYDFDPLSGQPAVPSSRANTLARRKIAYGRTSTLEVAIRAQAKRFIAHPLVVRHLQSIWAGDIVFHSAADSLHRYPSKPKLTHERHYGAMHAPPAPTDGRRPDSGRNPPPTSPGGVELIRRSVTLYDPANASPFKLSRLRCPRYRQLFSTMSYAVMLGLFLAVLMRRSLDLTPLEFVFWFWSAGFILDFVGFSEQGFGLYIASVWNVFDLGILLLFLVYYVLRLFGVLVAEDTQQKIANMAYDVLASTAVLLFPRMFNLLDHYRYFSQLLIAFRLMALDLAAVLVLIAIACSGFFVAFTLSFGQADFDGRGVAYALFQIIMGFTPAAWEVWDDFNFLGKALLALFLVICHFLVITILITVLTNSFMAIVKNANEEHQFLFAVNTISMVKSDMLFSFIAPTNLLGWIIAPLRFCIPFPKYVFVNRTLIKATHFPILFSIFAFERMSLLRHPFEPADYLERRGRTAQRMPTFGIGQDPRYQSHRLRMPSAATYQKDQALDEVFRRPFDDGSIARKPRPSTERRSSVVNVDTWMSAMSDGGLSPPAEQPRSILEQLEGARSRPRLPRSMTSQRLAAKTRSVTRSFVSDPDDSKPRRRSALPRRSEESDLIALGSDDKPAEADDEFTTNADTQEPSTLMQDDSDKENQRDTEDGHAVTATIKFREPVGSSPLNSTIRARVLSSSPGIFTSSPPAPSPNARRHNRQSSTNTILFRPVSEVGSSTSSPPPTPNRPPRRRVSRPATAIHSVMQSGQNTPRRGLDQMNKRPTASRARPIFPARESAVNKSVPNLSQYLGFSALNTQNRRAPSFDAVALDLASDIGDNRHNDAGGQAFLPGSFQTQMQYATDVLRRQKESDDSGAMNKLVLARMNRIEEGFSDILKEVKEWRNSGSRGASAGEDSSTPEKGAAAKATRAARRIEEKGTREPKRKQHLASQLTGDDFTGYSQDRMPTQAARPS